MSVLRRSRCHNRDQQSAIKVVGGGVTKWSEGGGGGREDLKSPTATLSRLSDVISKPENDESHWASLASCSSSASSFSRQVR